MTCAVTASTSRDEFERAKRSLAGGVDSPVRAGMPMGAPPPVIASARGSKVVDVEGREYVDYLCAYGPVLLGHGDPAIRDAIATAAERGTVLGVTHPEETRLAERIREHLPSMERLRFVSTGTEACMSVARVARSYARREKIVRFSGDYHGHADEMIFSAGASSNSAPAIDAGVTRATAANVIILPYNDVGAVERCLAESGGQIAALFVEPVCANMGLVLPAPGYLLALRDLTSRAGVLLVFDEIITGFRLALGGAQALYGVRPDLTCIGKTLGGGLPIAAYGGREDVMARLAPDGPVFQGGTFSGNPLCVAAAHAFLDSLEGDRGLHDRLDVLAKRLADGTRSAIASAGLEYPVVQLGSIVDFMFRRGAAHANFDQARDADRGAYARYYWKMLDAGVHLAPSTMEVMFLTAAHTERDVDATVAAIARSLQP
ncbi:MAG TPA: glutamate-1-semialdehyde 2,1-aminomutase [Candidatus Eremiobacteraceae bacterium]